MVGLRVVGGKGLYVRTLADDLAARLGGRAHLVSLRRIRVGSLGVGEVPGSGLGLDDLPDWEQWMLFPAEGLADLRGWAAPEGVLEMVKHGRRLPCDDAFSVAEGQPIRVLDGTGRLWAIYSRRRANLIPEVVLN